MHVALHNVITLNNPHKKAMMGTGSIAPAISFLSRAIIMASLWELAG
jgi:hypothetical protein